MKPRSPSNPQNLDELMVVAEDFAGFSLRSGRQIPPTLLAVTKKGPLFFTPASLQDDRSKDDFADTARLICIAYQVPAAVMILESCMKMAAEGEKLDPDERPSEAIDRHEVVMVMGEAAGTTQRKVLKIIRTDAGGFFGLTEWEGLPMDQFQGRFVDLLSPKPLTPEVIESCPGDARDEGVEQAAVAGRETTTSGTTWASKSSCQGSSMGTAAETSAA